jgi:hypothetical protein
VINILDNINKRPSREGTVEAPIIKFPDGLAPETKEERIQALAEKLKAYSDRLVEENPNLCNDPRVIRLGVGASDPARAIDAGMKQFISGRFLENPDRGINTFDLAEEYIAYLEVDGFDEDMFKGWNSACGTIYDYVTTGGMNTFGGTGFPSAK